MVVLIDLKIFMKAKHHFRRNTNQLTSIQSSTISLILSIMVSGGEGGGDLFTAWSKQGMENIFIKKIDKVVEQPIT